jgi:hypothetical protein
MPALLKLMFLALLLSAGPLRAQDAPESSDTEDPFAAFDDFDDEWEDEGGLSWTGFVESAYGRRLDADPNGLQRRTLGDLRARIETEWSAEAFRLTFKGDLLFDDYESESEAELRELAIQATPRSSIDLKVGRQVLTWGTGDLIFLNDLFPKNWVSFFFGREDDYLKDPSDAVRLTWYTDAVNVDVVWSPEFDPDNYLTGARASFFWPLTRRRHRRPAATARRSAARHRPRERRACVAPVQDRRIDRIRGLLLSGLFQASDWMLHWSLSSPSSPSSAPVCAGHSAADFSTRSSLITTRARTVAARIR